MSYVVLTKAKDESLYFTADRTAAEDIYQSEAACGLEVRLLCHAGNAWQIIKKQEAKQ